ncbi:hypothetical protein BBJ28_00018765 [Nothophytophthora sp. Chile5]|nr:hypothetical protein BBJ28_00018765 [Nothophytophthora sp. Chile5]
MLTDELNSDGEALPPLPAAPPGKKPRLNVHHAVVGQQQSLETVFPLLQQEVRTKTLRAPAVRHAVDAFYFHCAQQTESTRLDAAFRRELLQYFDEELFDWKDNATPAFVLGTSLNEAVFGSVIKLHLAHDDTEAAWELINKLRRAALAHAAETQKEPTKLHFRTVSPLLEHDCRRGRFLSAFSRWQELKLHDVEWTSAMEDVLTQMVIACIKHNRQQPETDSSEAHFHNQMTSLLHDLQVSCREVTVPNIQRLQNAFRDAGYIVKFVPSDAHMNSKCPCCGRALIKQDLSEAERELMLTAIETRRTKVTPKTTLAKEYLAPFRHWLLQRHEKFQLENPPPTSKRAKPLLHFVLDGPNVAYLNQNFDAGSCRVDQVDALARQLQAQGHLVSITMPNGYLADKFVLRIRTKKMKAARRQGKFSTRERTPLEKDILARWKDEDLVFSCLTNVLSDDLFWLYASVLLGREGRVVTNDQGRDHVYAMLNSDASANGNVTELKAKANDRETESPLISMDLIARWKELTTVNIVIKHEEVTQSSVTAADGMMTPIPIEEIRLLEPLPFSRVPQVTALQHFHFPITEHALQHEHPNQIHTQRQRTRWLCVHRKSSTK